MSLHEYVNVYESFYISADTYGSVWSPWLSTYADKSGVYGQHHNRPVDLLLEVFLHSSPLHCNLDDAVKILPSTQH